MERGVCGLCDDHLGLGDPPLLTGPLAGGEHAAQDRLGPTAGEEARDGVVAVEQPGRPADDLPLDLAERREGVAAREAVLRELASNR